MSSLSNSDFIIKHDNKDYIRFKKRYTFEHDIKMLIVYYHIFKYNTIKLEPFDIDSDDIIKDLKHNWNRLNLTESKFNEIIDNYKKYLSKVEKINNKYMICYYDWDDFWFYMSKYINSISLELMTIIDLKFIEIKFNHLEDKFINDYNSNTELNKYVKKYIHKYVITEIDEEISDIIDDYIHRHTVDNISEIMINIIENYNIYYNDITFDFILLIFKSIGVLNDEVITKIKNVVDIIK